MSIPGLQSWILLMAVAVPITVWRVAPGSFLVAAPLPDATKRRHQPISSARTGGVVGMLVSPIGGRPETASV